MVTVEGETYTIRRLTPTECARLQGFPDWWCADLGTADPTDEEVECWQEIFAENGRVLNGKLTNKSKAQVRKWLQQPHSDSAEYKMWGNGVALPCVDYVMAGIAYWSQKTDMQSHTVARQMTIDEWIKEAGYE